MTAGEKEEIFVQLSIAIQAFHDLWFSWYKTERWDEISPFVKKWSEQKWTNIIWTFSLIESEPFIVASCNDRLTAKYSLFLTS